MPRLAGTILLAVLLAVAATDVTAASGQADTGWGLPNLAQANLGATACTTNSLVVRGFGTSCTGNGGQPEAWSADFATWIWNSEGMNTAGVTNSTGNSIPNQFWKYGLSNTTLNTSSGYQPQAVIDTNTDPITVFLGSATGLSTTPTATSSNGWSTDYNHTGHYGIIAVQNDTQTQYFYPGDLTSGFGTRIAIGTTGWASIFSPMGVTDVTADFTGDGHADQLVCRTDTNVLDLYPGDGTGGSGPVTTLLTGCSGLTSFGVTDYSGDGHADLIVRDNATGALVLDTGGGTGWWATTPTTIATGW